MNIQSHIDTLNHSAYPLPAGLHCQWVLADPLHKSTKELAF